MFVIKYEVKKEKAVEVRTHDKNWNENDIRRDYDNKTEYYPELLKSFDTEEEAREYFESEKDYCSTTWWKGNGNTEGIYYDVLMLDEAEYDDDGEFIMSDTLEDYVVAYSE